MLGRGNQKKKSPPKYWCPAGQPFCNPSLLSMYSLSLTRSLSFISVSLSVFLSFSLSLFLSFSLLIFLSFFLSHNLCVLIGYLGGFAWGKLLEHLQTNPCCVEYAQVDLGGAAAMAALQRRCLGNFNLLRSKKKKYIIVILIIIGFYYYYYSVGRKKPVT